VREGDCLEASLSVNGVVISSLIERNIKRASKPSHII